MPSDDEKRFSDELHTLIDHPRPICLPVTLEHFHATVNFLSDYQKNSHYHLAFKPLCDQLRGSVREASGFVILTEFDTWRLAFNTYLKLFITGPGKHDNELLQAVAADAARAVAHFVCFSRNIKSVERMGTMFKDDTAPSLKEPVRSAQAVTKSNGVYRVMEGARCLKK